PASGPAAPAAAAGSPAPATAGGPGGTLPFTGSNVELILLASGLLLTTGAAAVRISSVVRPRLVG
ncbi:MAG TPA: hypothetical protein VGR90_03085, partial [Acidimicrobiales bacterium]|nr:hypothetical protein [Acidimicrobiales bacterium]